MIALRIGRLTDLGGILDGPVEIGERAELRLEQERRDSWGARFEIPALVALMLGSVFGLTMGVCKGWSGEMRWLTGLFLCCFVSLLGASYFAHDLGWDGHFFYTKLGGAASLFLLPAVLFYLKEVLRFTWGRRHWVLVGFFCVLALLFFFYPDFYRVTGKFCWIHPLGDSNCGWVDFVGPCRVWVAFDQRFEKEGSRCSLCRGRGGRDIAGISVFVMESLFARLGCPCRWSR